MKVYVVIGQGDAYYHDTFSTFEKANEYSEAFNKKGKGYIGRETKVIEVEVK